MMALDSRNQQKYRERPLGPFSNVICWFKGHVWEDDGFLTKGYECQRCWKMQRSIDAENDDSWWPIAVLAFYVLTVLVGVLATYCGVVTT